MHPMTMNQSGSKLSEGGTDMAGFIYFTEEQKQRANSVDLVDFLQRQGETFLPSGREKRLASDHSITVRGSRWYDHAEQTGGYAIDLIKRIYDISFPEAVSMLLGGEQGIVYKQYSRHKIESRKPFMLPEANSDMRRVYAYLMKQRYIANSIISEFAKCKLLYEDVKYHNAVFVGVDENGVPRHAHKKSTVTHGTGYRGNVEGSNPAYSFHYCSEHPSADTLFVFEAPIDLLSYLTMNQKDWKQAFYVACNGVSEKPVLKLLEIHPQITKVMLCLDHDIAGLEAEEKIYDLLKTKKHCQISVLRPVMKDWNEDLKAKHGIQAIPAVSHPQLMIRDRLYPEVWSLVQLLAENKTMPLNKLAAQYEKCKQRNNQGEYERVWEWLKDFTACSIILAAKEYKQAGYERSLTQITSDLRDSYRTHQNKGKPDHKLSDISNCLKSLFLMEQKIFEKGDISRANEYERMAKEFFNGAVLMEQHYLTQDLSQPENQYHWCQMS